MALCHPLVSPAIAESWTNFPPMWVACGEESTLDSCKVVASRAADQGTTIIWEEFEGLPHVFPLLPGLSQLPQVKRCLKDWAEFCRSCVIQPESLRSGELHIGYDGGVESMDTLKMPHKMKFPEVKERMQKAMVDIEQSFQRRQQSHSKL